MHTLTVVIVHGSHLAGIGRCVQGSKLLKRRVTQAQQVVALHLHSVAETRPVDGHPAGIRGAPRRCCCPLNERCKIVPDSNLCLT